MSAATGAAITKMTSEIPALPLGIAASQTTAPGPKDPAEVLNWLSFHRLWGQLDDAALAAIAESLQSFKLAAGSEIYREGQAAIGLYWLKWGSVEIYRPSALGKMHILYRSAGDLFGYAPLVASSEVAQGSRPMATTYQASAMAVSASEIWFLPRADFERLRQIFPLLQSLINQILVKDLGFFAQRISREQTRIQGLQDWIRPTPPDARLIGTSKVAQKLTQQIERATQDVQPIVFQGANGTGKSFLAGYLHYQSGLRDRPFAEIDCTKLPCDAAGQVNSDVIFGREGGALGVLELLERGTLLLDRVHILSSADRQRLVDYLATGSFTRNRVIDENANQQANSETTQATSSFAVES
jgi:transcriptional regulator with AAA-type ATPase domain